MTRREFFRVFGVGVAGLALRAVPTGSKQTLYMKKPDQGEVTNSKHPLSEGMVSAWFYNNHPAYLWGRNLSVREKEEVTRNPYWMYLDWRD